MVATWSAAASSSYYTSQTEYYLSVGAPTGHWYCPSGELGIADKSDVLHQDFERLFSGITKDTALSLTNRNRIDRVPAFDFTFSAPRSVSIVWAFSCPETRLAIERAQAKATRTTLSILESEASFARRGKGGKRYERVQLTAACFFHSDSRPSEHTCGQVFSDPNIHTHAVIMNLAVRADGTRGALHSTVLRDWKMAAGAVYHASLSAELQAAGFSVDRIGKNGIFEIAGIEDEVIQFFSARRREIIHQLEQANTTSAASPRLAASISKSTRKNKTKEHSKSNSVSWLEAAKKNNIKAHEIEKNARLVASLHKLNNPLPSVETCLETLPHELTQTNSVINRRELLRACAAALVKTGVSGENVKQYADAMITRGEFIALGRDAVGQERYSTPEMIRIEREIVSVAAHLTASIWQSISTTETQHRCAKHLLSKEQSAAVIAATTNNRLAIIEGAPGSGKTTTIAPIVEAYKAAGCRVIGAASAWRVANMLRDDLQIESRAVASWLEAAKKGQSFLDSSTLIVVDEAGLLSSRDMHSIIKAVEKFGAKLLLVGDRNQLQAIGAGPGLTLVARAVESIHVSTIVRQKEAWVREAINAFGKGHVEQALDSFVKHDQLVEVEGARQAILAAVDGWENKQLSSPSESILLIAKTNAEVAEISKEVRARQLLAGKIYGPSISIRASTPSGHTTEISLAAGDKIRFLQRNDMLGVVNGTIGTVIKVSGLSNAQNSSKQLIVAEVEGRRISFSPSDLADHKGRSRIGWAYASTVYGAQGLTVDHAVVLLSPSFDRHDGYVAISRSRNQTKLIIDKHNIDLMSGSISSQCLTTVERRKLLAARLSLSNPKESTLDFIDFQLLKHEIAIKEKLLQLDIESSL